MPSVPTKCCKDSSVRNCANLTSEDFELCFLSAAKVGYRAIYAKRIHRPLSTQNVSSQTFTYICIFKIVIGGSITEINRLSHKRSAADIWKGRNHPRLYFCLIPTLVISLNFSKNKISPLQV